MELKITSLQSRDVVALEGDVDLSNSKQVKQSIIALIKQGSDVVVDISALNYIDSSGMASLVEALNESKQAGSEFHIAGAQGAPLQVFKLTRLDTVFSMVDSVDALS